MDIRNIKTIGELRNPAMYPVSKRRNPAKPDKQIAEHMKIRFNGLLDMKKP